jgi:homoserine dehydrogenase
MISSIEGIFNGSTNYILTKVFDEKKSYAEALRQAQELGFAESDPSLDVKGFDPKYKLVIAIAHTFGLFVPPEKVINIGIDRISDVDLKFARENNYTIKLIARAFKEDGKVYGFVAPQFIENINPLASVRNEFNAVQVKGAFAETQLFIGKGAGSYPTGSAVLSDISALAYGYAYEYKKHQQDTDLEFSNDLSVEAYISFDQDNQVTISDFVEFKSGYATRGKQYMLGRITLSKLLALSLQDGIGIILAPKAVVPQSSTVKQLAVA